MLENTTKSTATQSPDYGFTKRFRKIMSLERERAFTRAYAAHEFEHAYEREIACLAVQIPAMCAPLRPGDWFAGRVEPMAVGINPERGGLTQAAYYIDQEMLTGQLDNPDVGLSVKNDIRFLLDFWAERETGQACRAAFEPDVASGLPSDDYYSGKEIAYPMYGLGGPCLDFGKLTRLGLSGLRSEIESSSLRKGPGDPDRDHFYRSLLVSLDLFETVMRDYAQQAHDLAHSALNAQDTARAEQVGRTLDALVDRPPQTYHEAVQLVWLYAIVSMVKNYGRLDCTLGPFLASDLDNGILTDADAREMTAGLWHQMQEQGDNFNGRVVIGGAGRADSASADRFAFLALDTHESHGGVLPQLSLRWYSGMDPRLWERGLAVLRKGTTFPILYNDDITVPALAKGFGVSITEAQQYVPYGCGEFVLEHASIGSPDAALNVLKAVNVTLGNGIDYVDNARRGLALGGLERMASFEQLKSAVEAQIEHQVNLLARCQATVYRVTGEQAAFPFLSMLYDDCIGRGKALLAGGVRYCGGTLESFGNNSAADSLTAIKYAVYDHNLVSPRDLIQALKNNFVGYEQVRTTLLASPRFGNDNPEADAMSVWLNEMVCETTRRCGTAAGLDHFSVVLINNGDSVMFGKTTGASADGRLLGVPLSNGNQPSAGSDVCGPTALLNSMAKLNPAVHAGAVHNVRFSRATFDKHPGSVHGLLRGYFSSGGTQAMVTVTNRDDLEKARAHPELYANLIVRVGGYSEYFVDLPPDIQDEVMRRTLY